MVSQWRKLWKSEVGKTDPIYRVLVPDSVPPSVRQVWRARGYRFGAGDPGAALVHAGMRRNVIPSNAAFQFSRGATTVATSSALIPTGLVWLIDGTLAAGGVITGGIFAVLGGGLTLRTWLTTRRDPKRLRPEQKQHAAAARWISPAELGYVAGKGGQDTDEQRLFHLAVVIARRITQTRAWTHPVLEGHVSRVDLDHAVGSIGSRLQELVELRAELEAVREPVTAKRVDAYLAKLAKAFSSIASRVVSMHEYYEHLLDLDRQITVLENTERSKQLGDRVLDVLARTADDDDADWTFRELNIDADSHADVIRGLLSELEETAGEFDDFDPADDLDRRLAEAQSQAGKQRGRRKKDQGTAPEAPGTSAAPAPVGMPRAVAPDGTYRMAGGAPRAQEDRTAGGQTARELTETTPGPQIHEFLRARDAEKEAERGGQ
ncbi:hypothetical protein [Brevibacterium litoralis]|uniref:hypothetical protein n=1 Tax=Brevibacterium litoralis TaxID=3138935 RepID=UPI0032EF5A7E